MSKKHLMYVVFVVAAVLSLGVVGVLAHSTPSSNSGPGSSGPVILNIGPNGNTLLRGVIKSVGTDSLVVTSWGGDWNIKVMPTTQIISLNRTLADFQVGNFAGVLGTTSQDGDFVVEARIVRSWGPRADSDADGISDDQDGISDGRDDDDDNDDLDDDEDLRDDDHDNDGVSDKDDDDDVDDDDDNSGSNSGSN